MYRKESLCKEDVDDDIYKRRQNGFPMSNQQGGKVVKDALLLHQTTLSQYGGSWTAEIQALNQSLRENPNQIGHFPGS
jgi:hypothetical protein